MKIPSSFFLIAIVFITSSCVNETESDIIGNSSQVTITYANTIKSIIDNNCISCHSNTPTNGASISLTTLQNVKNGIINNTLIEKISKAQGADGMMPYGGTRLPQSKIDEIISWKNAGFEQ
ncbi:c-type cytochrome [Flavobacterium sp.]|uniref:c-type cytochrome n=1 Tax=Flavobacterium sp. TaxID=239 RepID=UPI00286C7EBB|nr:hypothetical protein [Flavobacterium sp.]